MGEKLRSVEVETDNPQSRRTNTLVEKEWNCREFSSSTQGVQLNAGWLEGENNLGNKQESGREMAKKI